MKSTFGILVGVPVRQELGCLQGVGGEEWSHFRMGKETDAFMRGFIGNSPLT